MAGRIREEDIAEVREKSRIDDVVSQYVTLRNAGGGSQKGLCPFHDEKSPSFNVNPSRGFFHCFGCGEGGDVITFLMKIDGLSFGEAVERLAEKVGVVLRREEDDGQREARAPGGWHGSERSGGWVQGAHEDRQDDDDELGDEDPDAVVHDDGPGTIGADPVRTCTGSSVSTIFPSTASTRRVSHTIASF